MSIELKINKLWNEREGSFHEESWFKEGARAMAKELSREEAKIIDLSIVAGSNIPMLFKMSRSDSCKWIPGFLKRGGPLGYRRENYDSKGNSIDDMHFDLCKFDTTRPVAWFGGDCPLPEGVEAKVWFRRGTWQQAKNVGTAAWTRKASDRGMDIIAFQVTGLAPGYKYPWE